MKESLLTRFGMGLEVYFKHLLWNLGLVGFNMLHAAIHVVHGVFPFLLKTHGEKGIFAYKDTFENKF